MAVALKKSKNYSVVKVKPDSAAERKLEFVYEFSCDCGNVWTSGRAVDGKKMVCRKCSEKVLPRRKKRRWYGKYKCPKCGRYWESAYSWRGKGQECKDCRINVLAFKLRPLKKSDGLDKGDKKKPHIRDLCEMCKLHGCCMNYSGFSSDEADQYESEPELKGSREKQKRQTRGERSRSQKHNNNFREEYREDTPEDSCGSNSQRSQDHKKYCKNTTENKMINFLSNEKKKEDHRKKKKSGHTAVVQEAKVRGPRLETSTPRNIKSLDQGKIKRKSSKRKEESKESH